MKESSFKPDFICHRNIESLISVESFLSFFIVNSHLIHY